MQAARPGTPGRAAQNRKKLFLISKIKRKEVIELSRRLPGRAAALNYTGDAAPFAKAKSARAHTRARTKTSF
jgi:hypothetical protein